MLEFTGERVVPGKVDPDLWNEHLSRYLFAARLARGKRVADLGCGTGYGAAELARTAASVTGFDVSRDAVEYAQERYGSPALSFAIAPVESVPTEDGAFDLVVSFEVIEHLADSGALIREARRLVSSSGQFVVSTPNREYYAESRRASGPNPFHTREFSLAEFRELLGAHFPHVTLFTQNHAEVLAIRPIDDSPGQAVVRTQGASQPEAAHFFIAVCALAPQIGSPTFFYVPTTANVLRERERHIHRLENELAKKQEWLDRSLAEHAGLVAQYRSQEAELKRAHEWLSVRDAELAEKISHVEKLQAEVAERADHLQRAVDQLHSTEAELESAVKWAQTLAHEKSFAQSEKDEILARVAGSRWIRLGRKLGLGPDIRP